jgi:hypothetical protein
MIFVSLLESRSQFQCTTSITYTDFAYSQMYYFSTISKYSDFTHCVNIDILRTYSSLPSSQSHIHVHTTCGKKKVMRLAKLCTNRQGCCIPLHMAVTLTPAVDSVQVWTCYSCYAIVESVGSEVVFVRWVTKIDQQKFEQSCAIKFYVILGESDKKDFFF